MAIRYTFKVFERLKREQHIKTLFQTGKAFSSFPLKCIWLPLLRDKDELSPVRIAVSVPKKRIPLSVNRHRIKRLIRESWRLQKHILYPQVPEAKQLHLFFIYTGPPTTDMESMNKAMQKIIRTLTEQLNNSKDA